VLSRLFRGKFLAALARARERGELQFPGTITDLADAGTFGALLDQLYRQEWVVYAKRPFGGPTQVFHYLGRYTHRVGLSNHRLQAITPDAVRFATKHGHRVTVPPREFLRRFLLHVLPAGFVKIRLCHPTPREKAAHEGGPSSSTVVGFAAHEHSVG